MAENITVSDIIPARAERVFTAWLDPVEHGKMTGSSATDEGGGRFTAWDGYISGRTVSSVPHSKIVQAWRTTEFTGADPDSILTVLLEPTKGGTRVTLVHENIPDGQADGYQKGWEEFYFTPMKAYFASPGAKMREVGEKLGDALEEVAKDAQQVVKKAQANVQKEARRAARDLKKVEKKVAASVKQLGKKVRALVARKGAKKPAKVAAKKPARAPSKKAAPARKAAKKPAAGKAKKR